MQIIIPTLTFMIKFPVKKERKKEVVTNGKKKNSVKEEQRELKTIVHLQN